MEVLPLRAFADNYIWALRENGCVAVVDPGEAGPVLRHLESSGDKLAAILLTHHHDDHVGGTAELLGHTAVPVYGPDREEIPFLTHPLHDGEQVELAWMEGDFQVMQLPGHTFGHLAYYRPGMVFCGDVLFNLGCGRIFESTMDAMWLSLQALAALPADTRVYCAHEYTYLNLPFALAVEPGNPALQARAAQLRPMIAAGQATVPTTLAAELATNPFLRCHEPEVIASASRHAGHALQQPDQVFAALREWRNSFKPLAEQ